ncbi:MAG: major facilitator superfamily 1 [Gammaproteobacteria bacterium]|nr:major facilitator superfamily 1 [Gammaproteobacteria bacterium]
MARSSVLALSVLTLINLLNYLDRYVVSAIVPDLKGPEMGLSDLQIGSLMTAFMLVYMVAAPVFGVLGDRGSRTRPIAVGVFLWSLATVLSGFAANYAHLVGARALVGIGEAAYVTIAPALLADCFSRAQRGRVLSVFNMAIPVGAALGYIVGGLVSHHYGWRAAFFVAGAPGLLLAVWVLRLPDPPRGSQDGPGLDESSGAAQSGAARSGAVANALAVYWSLLRRLPYMLVVLGYAAYTFAMGGLAFWMPTFLQRVHGIAAAQATTGFGAIVVVTGFLGTFAGGWLGDYWLKSSRQAYLWMSGWITLLAVPFAFVALTAAAPSVYYPAIVVAELLLFMSTGPVNSAIINLVSPTERASAVALSMFTIHLLGDVTSPSLIGGLSDAFSLGKAVLVVPLAVTVSGIVWLASAKVCAATPASR